eukprot:7693015-Pyramimonas_sp.AAC.1
MELVSIRGGQPCFPLHAQALELCVFWWHLGPGTQAPSAPPRSFVIVIYGGVGGIENIWP